MVTWPTSRDLERSNSWPSYAYSAISWKLLKLETSNLVCSFLSGIPSGRTNNFPDSGRGLGHVTATIFGIRSNISLKLIELETSNLVHGFVWAMPSRRTNKFPWKWVWPRSRNPYNFWHYGRLSYRQLGFLFWSVMSKNVKKRRKRYPTFHSSPLVNC